MANPLMTGFNQGVDPSDQWNKLTPDDARGPLTIDPQGAALARQFYAIRDSIAGEQAPIWNQNNPVGTETLQSMGMPQPTTYAGPVGQFIDPATGRMTTQGMARMDNPAMGFDTGGIGGMAEHFISYHGSPHDFPPTPTNPYGAFSDAAIGSGEGAQAYGHGHYTADAEGVARGYRDALSIASPELTTKGLSPEADEWVRYAVGETPGATEKDIPRLFARFKDDPVAQEILAAHGNGQIGMSSPTGHMYEVKINADPAHFLDWDKPLSEQHPVVQQNLADIIRYQQVPLKNNAGGETTGGQLYDYLQRRFNNDPHIAAQELHGEGIPGIRYLDAGSRGAGEGSRNSVVFDPANMEIIRKYGLAWLLGGGAAGAAATQGTPQQ